MRDLDFIWGQLLLNTHIYDIMRRLGLISPGLALATGRTFMRYMSRHTKAYLSIWLPSAHNGFAVCIVIPCWHYPLERLGYLEFSRYTFEAPVLNFTLLHHTTAKVPR